MNQTQTDELNKLIKEQAHDMKYGHRVNRDKADTLPIDPVLQNGGTRNPTKKFRSPLSKNDPRHGTVAGYEYCHCDKCKRAQAAYKANLRKNRKGLPPNDSRHGTLNGYRNWNCHCEKCRAANAKYVRERRKKSESHSN